MGAWPTECQQSSPASRVAEEGMVNIDAVDTGGSTAAVLAVRRNRRQFGGHCPPDFGSGGHLGRLQPPHQRQGNALGQYSLVKEKGRLLAVDGYPVV